MLFQLFVELDVEMHHDHHALLGFLQAASAGKSGAKRNDWGWSAGVRKDTSNSHDELKTRLLLT